MILLTPDLRDRLLVNGRMPDADHVPVVKFFNPLGEGVWLATELDPDGDTLFGLADLGEPELGPFQPKRDGAGPPAVRTRNRARPTVRGNGPNLKLGRSRPANGQHPRGGACALRGCPGKATGRVMCPRRRPDGCDDIFGV